MDLRGGHTKTAKDFDQKYLKPYTNIANTLLKFHFKLKKIISLPRYIFKKGRFPFSINSDENWLRTWLQVRLLKNVIHKVLCVSYEGWMQSLYNR